MTTVTFDVSYGTRAVPFRLPYLSVRRHRTVAGHPDRAPRAPRTAHASGATARTVDRALAARDSSLDRGLALRAGAGV
jgi:hypothetical protein